jgi:ribosomal protein L22
MEDFEIRAQNRYVWQSARKVRLVVDRVRGMDALEALGVLRLMPQRAARGRFKPIQKRSSHITVVLRERMPTES